MALPRAGTSGAREGPKEPPETVVGITVPNVRGLGPASQPRPHS